MGSILLVFYFVMNRNSFLGTTPAPILYKLLYLIRWAKQNRVLHLIIWCLVIFWVAISETSSRLSICGSDEDWKCWPDKLKLCSPWTIQSKSDFSAVVYRFVFLDHWDWYRNYLLYLVQLDVLVSLASNTSSIVRLNSSWLNRLCKMMHYLYHISVIQRILGLRPWW